ncbi:unnamed protein product [Symbiodinium sp. CCMP2592]|nr:unnamed protein product [Symbiodinium sp. CCMP2592]
MAGSAVMLDDPAAFTGLLTRWAVPDAVKDKLHDAGYNTMALLAHALPSLDDLEAFVESWLGRAVGADPTVPIFSPEAAALRRVLKECINLAGPAGASSPAAPTPVMPSLPFLNAVKDAVDSKQLSWISWRLRTSESDEQALTERRKPRTDLQMLQSLLGPVSDELVVDVPQHLPLESVIRRYLDRVSYALAVLDACHLLTLKKLSEKFVSLATAIPIDRSLRGPTLAEAMDADRVLWSAICSLQKEYGWSLQDCVSELTHVRSDLHNALAPRPKMHQGGGEPRGKRQRTEPPPAPHPNPRAKAKSKAKPRKSADAGSSKDRVSISNWPSNWARQIGSLTFCCKKHLTLMIGFFHSSFVLIDGIASEAHCDTANSDLPNVVIPISCFSGGELRVAHPSGADVMVHDGVKRPAVSLPVCRGPVIFTASSCLHEVLPFEGRRLVLVGYTLRACESLAADQRDLLPRPNSVSAVGSGHQLRPGICPDLPQLPDSDFVCDCNSGRFFLDICSGAGAPVSAAMQALGKDCFQPVDIIHCQDFDLLDDDFFAQLLALCSSGVVGAAIASPPCGEFSLLKLRPGGPPPCRTPEEPLGCLSNDWHQSMVAQNSALLHDRCRELLSSVAALGGCIVFEQPPSSMTFLTETMQQWTSSTLSFGAQVAACHQGMDVSKRWLFLSNRPDILDLASECQHGSRAHKAVWGIRADDGSFLSRMTAAYPKSLAAALAALLGKYTSSQGRLLPCAEWRSVLPLDPVWPQLGRRVEDGAGVNSTACWITPQADDHLAGLRKKWTQHLVDSRLCLRICSTLRAGTDCPPISAEELQPFLDDLCCFCEVPATEFENFLSIQPGQPFRMNVLEKLLAVCECTADPIVSDLVICEGSWKSASDHPEQVRELLAQEIAEGWIVERPSVQYLHDHFPAVAIGKLGLVLAEGRSPRLTVDSSISGVTAACQIPNHMLLPRISDVEDCAPSCLGRQPWITISLDVRKAHRMVMVEHCDQALLAFTFEGRVFTSSTLNFGARASAFWWARVGGALLRLSHAAIWLSHLLWGYVDDFLGGFRGDVAPISASIWILLLLALGVPLSWPKCVWSSECIWIGWSINLESWVCELPSAKISKILDQIAELLSAGDKVKFKTLESLIGRLLWVTGLWTVLRPLLSPLYAALQRLPASSVGVSPELWAAIKRDIAEDCVLTRSVGHPSFHKGACVTRAANTFVSCKQDLDQVPFRKRRLWVEVKDPGHPLRVLGDVGRSSLIAWRAIFQGTPFMKALRSPLPLKVIAEADAFADAEAHISALELLAQLLLLWCVFATLPSNRGLCRACLRSDNSGAEACASKGLSSVLSMSEIVKKFLAFQAWSGVQAEVEHVPGYRNELADALSRLTPTDIAPLPLGDRVHPPLQWLLEQRLLLVLMLRAEVASLRNSSLAALWDAIYALQVQLNEVRPRGEDDHFSFVFTAVEENTAARLLRSPLANVRCLRYHEQRLDALVNLNADIERRLRSLDLALSRASG